LIKKNHLARLNIFVQILKIMPNYLSENPAAPLKKTWANPELILISHDDVTISKHSPHVHEGTGTFKDLGNGPFFYNQSLGWAVTNKLSAVS